MTGPPLTLPLQKALAVNRSRRWLAPVAGPVTAYGGPGGPAPRSSGTAEWPMYRTEA